jgi:hypothetical protein
MGSNGPNKELTNSCVQHERNLFSSLLDYSPARTYCRFSSPRELFEDPLPSLSLFLVYPQALLVYLAPRDILPRACTVLLILTATSIIITAGIRIAIAQTDIVADSSRTASLRNGSYRSAIHKLGLRYMVARGVSTRVPWQSRRATRQELGCGMIAYAGQEEQLLL